MSVEGRSTEMSRSRSPDSRGVLFIVGTGPGDAGHITSHALYVIAQSEYVVGHRFYLDMLGEALKGKQVVSSSMGGEVERAQRSVELAKDHVVTIVSGGDPGVYGMASIVLEVMDSLGLDIPVEVVPGVTAATAAAARLGSPLSGDFAVISLSDLFTPWESIVKRLEAVLSAGIPVVLYNPRSEQRSGNLHSALAIAARALPEGTPVGVVRNAYRPDEEVRVTTLGGLLQDDSFVDMRSTVIIGRAESRLWRVGRNVKGIITPRGYARKYVY